MADSGQLAARFENERGRLRAVAYRLLGSVSSAEDAVQEAWIRLSKSDASEIENLPGWLTVAVSRICLDGVRAARARREELVGVRLPDPIVSSYETDRALWTSEAVGLALQVVVSELRPNERVAFVLHDLFDVPFKSVATVLGASEPAVRQMASRARRRVRDTRVEPDASLPDQREVVNAFLQAAREGDMEGLLGVLHPDCVLRADAGPNMPGLSQIVRGGDEVAGQAIRFSSPSHTVQHVLVNGAAGILVGPDDRVFSLTAFTIVGGRVVAMDILADPDRLQAALAEALV